MHGFAEDTVPGFALVSGLVLVLGHHGAELVKGDRDTVEGQVAEWCVDAMA